MDRPVHVFVWRDGVGDAFTVDLVNGVQRELDDQPVDVLVLVNGPDVLQDLQDGRSEVRGQRWPKPDHWREC